MRFVESSISFGVESSIWCLNLGVIFSFISFLWVGVRSFESFVPHDFIFCSSSGFVMTPARIIGPRTGPRPASSIPMSFMLHKEEKAL